MLPQHIHCIYTLFSSLFSLSCLPRPVHCPLTKMPCYLTITLFQYGAGVADDRQSSEQLKH